MKKIVIAIVMVFIAVSLTACGEKKPSDNDTGVPNIPVEKANEEYFLWEDTEIVGYTEEGLKQKHITIPASCTGFGYSALQNNTVVETITFETDYIELSKWLFSGCTALKFVELPVSIGDTLPAKVFFGCDALEAMTIPKGVKTIGEKAFYDCDMLRTIDIPESVTVIEESAFAFCPVLKTVSLHDGLVKIEKSAFEAAGLEALELPGTVTVIEEEVFYMCDNLTTVKIPEGVTIIESFAFSTCAGLKDIYLPASVTDIKNTAFTQFHDINIHVIEGSFADAFVDENNDGFGIKKYY